MTPKQPDMFEMKMLLISAFFLSAGGMTSDTDEWRIIGGCTLGGAFGAFPGLLLALSDKEEGSWRKWLMRLLANFFFAIFAGSGLIYWMFFHLNWPVGPLLCVFVGGISGMLGMLLLQILMPRLVKKLEKKVDSI